ncbi:hypothetical protein [Paraglaciecola sp. L3A3]|uniref:hypothetical protein n=1 Tax=Paraglaciecola sp. L3A3 TaxID=2686358 RepID=UPI00131E6F08|nr:hypothetical protein [Paraglaciecola sp. L3A3]
MENKLIVSPDAVILNAFINKNADGKPGMLSLNAQSSDDDDKVDINVLLNHPDGNVEILVLEPSDGTANSVILILPSLTDYLTLQFGNKPTSSEQITTLIQEWQQYFKACRQLLLLYPDTFKAKGMAISQSECVKESIQCILLSDPQLAQEHEDWSSFVVDKHDNLRPVTQIVADLGTKLSSAATLKISLDKQQKEHAETTKQTSEAMAQKNSKIIELTKLQQEIQNAQQQLTKNLTDKTHELDKITELNNSLQNQLESTVKVKKSLQQQFEDTNNQLITEQIRVKETKAKLDQKVQFLEQKNNENEIFTLQINQLKEELESTFTAKKSLQLLLEETNDKLITEQKQHQKKDQENQMANEQIKSEKELLLLQIAQLQEEIEHYFLEYNKVSKTSEPEKNNELLNFKKEVQARYPQLLTAQKCTVTGGFDKAPFYRAVFKLEQITNFDKSWANFNLILNDRKNILDIEFQAADKNRVYPLSTFIKSGNNKVSDYTLITPYTAAGLNTYKQLPDSDQALLKSILNEIVLKLTTQQITRSGPGKNIDINAWVSKIQKLIKDLQTPGDLSAKETAPKPAKVLVSSLGQVTLLQNMVAQNNEHLSIRIKDLKIGSTHYPIYEFKVGAKKIHPTNFTKLGSLEFRELKNKKAPLPDWSPKQNDKWGPKLMLDITPTPTNVHLAEWSTLSANNRDFIATLLPLIAANIHNLKLNDIKLNQPIEHWYQLLTAMTQSFNTK